MLFIVMDCLSMSLRHLISNGAVKTSEHGLVLLLQLCKAVEHMVRHEVCHRDLKPDNVLVEMQPHGYERLVIADFGESLDSLSLAYPDGHIPKRGAHTYQAPEIVDALPGW